MLSLLLLLFFSLFFHWSDGSKSSLNMVADVLFYKCWTYVKWSLLYQAFGVWLFQLWYSNMCAKHTLFISLNLICCISSVKLLCFLLFLITLLFRLELLLPGTKKNVFFFQQCSSKMQKYMCAASAWILRLFLIASMWLWMWMEIVKLCTLLLITISSIFSYRPLT